MNVFRKTYIEITNVCNRSCDFCPGTARPAEFMERGLFETILSRLNTASRLLHFHVLGEPLLHPDIAMFLDLCRPYGYHVNVVTNGTSLTEKGLPILGKPALRQISVSLHGLSEQSTEHSVDDFLKDLFTFLEKAQRHPHLQVSLRLWNREAIASQDFWNGILEKILGTCSRPILRVNDLSPQKPLQLNKNLWLNSGPRFQWPGLNNPALGEKGFCLGLQDQIAVLVDGTVVPCCLDADGIINLGNIKRASLQEILSGPKAVAIREG